MNLLNDRDNLLGLESSLTNSQMAMKEKVSIIIIQNIRTRQVKSQVPIMPGKNSSQMQFASPS